MVHALTRHLRAVSLVGLVVVAVSGALLVANSARAAGTPAAASASHSGRNSFTFNLVPSNAAIKACLPKASGRVTITKLDQNDRMTIHVEDLAPNTGYDLFVIQQPGAPFGVSWYQSDLETNRHGDGTVTVQGIFNVETFSISQGQSADVNPKVTFGTVHQYHLGLWFNDPNVPFKLGCEPGKTAPLITPFNGEQHAGIQVLNTSNFPNNAGPLSHVSA